MKNPPRCFKDDIPNNILLGIGQVACQWSGLEFALQNVYCRLRGINKYANDNNFKINYWMWGDAYREFKNLAKNNTLSSDKISVLDCILGHEVQVAQLAKKRNDYMHGLVSGFKEIDRGLTVEEAAKMLNEGRKPPPKTEEVETIIVRPNKDEKKLYHISVTEADLTNLAYEIAMLEESFLILLAKIPRETK